MNPHNKVTSARTILISVYRKRRPRHREGKSCVEGTRLERGKDEITCAGCLPFAVRIPPPPSHPGLCPGSLMCMGCTSGFLTVHLLLGFGQWEAWLGPGGGRRDGGSVCSLSFLPAKHQGHGSGQVTLTLMVRCLGSGTRSLPFPLQPCRGTTLALTTWGFCTTPCWFP